MSDSLSDTPEIARLFCPECEPEADQIAEVLTVRWCALHQRVLAGIDDERVDAGTFLTGSGEADGADCRIMAEVLRRA